MKKWADIKSKKMSPERIERVRKEAQAVRRKGRPAEGTVSVTVRLPQSTYDELVRLAKEQGISTHVALRKAVASWIVKARKAS